MSDPRTAARRLPDDPGVYRFRDGGGAVLYVGRAVDLRRRVLSYWSDRRERRHLEAMVARIAAVEAVPCDSAHEAAWLERNLLERSLPPWNRSAGGQEAVAWVRLDDGPAAPGLHLEREIPPACRGSRGRGHWWGPYLGGSRVRLAIAGLHRAHPLPCAGDTLDSVSRELAEARGIAATDRPALTAALRDVLAGRARARAEVLTRLAARRDEAAAAQAYERAAAIQAELEAVAWVFAPQRVTTRQPRDHVVHGWADGVLTSFEIRAGRLDGWTCRAAGREETAAATAATPRIWRIFATRAAALAARLAA